eukprot:s121_g21.t1
MQRTDQRTADLAGACQPTGLAIRREETLQTTTDMAFFQQKQSCHSGRLRPSVLSNLAAKAAAFGRRVGAFEPSTRPVDAMAGAGNRRGAGAERDRRRRGPLEAEAASDRERPAAAGAKGQPRHRTGGPLTRRCGLQFASFQALQAGAAGLVVRVLLPFILLPPGQKVYSKQQQ